MEGAPRTQELTDTRTWRIVRLMVAFLFDAWLCRGCTAIGEFADRCSICGSDDLVRLAPLIPVDQLVPRR